MNQCHIKSSVLDLRFTNDETHISRISTINDVLYMTFIV
ncbi:hypothetical protein PU02_0536 [Bartonella ancashensis]|uniref:Uncharacterized protein n=1 Tax=Bartonella ancashensis TaxID=1318743 RepID=A0A0M4L7S1_9HYPH|nr:hypothetical protein PU02_0536 [Bartonella ancashensis]